MSNIKTIFEENIVEIIEDLNAELLQDRIINFWKKVGSHLTLTELVNTYWGEVKSEFAVDLGVTFGKIFELYLPFKLQSLGYNVKPRFSSAGDMIEELKQVAKHWELKTGRGDFIQGATHSPKEKGKMNLIQVLWDCHWDKSLDDIMKTGEFISVINVCIFEDTIVNSIGEHSNNNSRTVLKFTRDRYDDCLEACVYGNIKKNRINVGFVKTPAPVNVLALV